MKNKQHSVSDNINWEQQHSEKNCVQQWHKNKQRNTENSCLRLRPNLEKTKAFTIQTSAERTSPSKLDQKKLHHTPKISFNKGRETYISNNQLQISNQKVRNYLKLSLPWNRRHRDHTVHTFLVFLQAQIIILWHK